MELLIVCEEKAPEPYGMWDCSPPTVAVFVTGQSCFNHSLCTKFQSIVYTLTPILQCPSSKVCSGCTTKA